ncbi:MAG TPA: PHB depolymerase family esterase, partial [Steroidobacteraceae bacterium]|nr:PHB depolymerase family esterase [Steroidobacteraceae bacterium]
MGSTTRVWRRLRARALWLSAAAPLVAALALADELRGAPVGLQPQVVFSDYSALSATSELVRRLFSPLAAAQIQQQLARSGKQLIEQSVDLAAERFSVFVPAQAPPQGYALLVFVPPWRDAVLPRGWATALERYGVIFVSAANSGNDAEVLGRREPLALLAARNIMARYTVDPTRVFIGGFSGGSRIAMRLALAYPDLFSGALLNAGSDPLDAGPPTLPPRELLLRFQQNSRIVYVTGERDTTHQAMDAGSLLSMRKWCVFNADSEITPAAGHEVADPAALSGALHLLLAPARSDPGKLAACRADIEKKLTAQLGQVDSL